MSSSSGNKWDPDKILKLYLHDYMIKKGMHETAAIFKKEADIDNSPIVIDSPDGFLHEWWSIFYETYSSKQNNQKNGPESSSKATQKTDDRICIPPVISQPSTTKQRPQQLQISSNFNRTIGQPVACPFPSKVYHRDHLSYLAKDADQSIHPINANKLKFMAGSSSNHMQQDISKLPQEQIFRESGGGIHLGSDVPRDPRDIVPRTIQPVDRLFETKASEGFNLVPLNGSWPPLNVGGEITQIMFQMAQAVIQQNQGQQLLSRDVENIKRRTALSSRVQENILDHVNAEEDRPVDENVDSFLSNENENADNRGVPFSNLKRISATCNPNEGFSFEEVGCLHSSKGKVLSCHFSSDGKVLASAGHEKKVVFIWNMETFDCVSTSEAHSLLITDVRFRPGSTIFATSSFDRTVKIWDAAKPNKSLFKFTGHAEQVMSLDFHPRKADLLCSCDNNDIIRLWNLNLSVCMHVIKGASKQVRFQPRFGKLLATATGNSINVIDIESNSLLYNLKGHVKDVLSICWEASGNYIASVSEDKACMWSVISGGKCIHELCLNGNKFQSCAFHPGYSNLVVIGGYQSLELWSPSESSKSWGIPAHKGLIAGLAESQQNQMMASASHDHCVKLWK
ncbi:hypothetical protein L6164_036692 [Bauhinia variegata]|uniref:Uncharacterized protein n=1 Tax=Bauhinia variegata TaxID=167791 RepID=A0ACB9KHU7_BAUVA|nr:hypothetical protein L6164_036692 [Bauhinia variegata]